MRLTVVQRVTGVNSRTLRSLWHEINHNNPSSGRLKDTVSNSIRSYEEATKLAAFVSLYKTIYHNKKKFTYSANNIQFDTTILIEAWEDFRKLNDEININLAYYAIRDMSAGIVQQKECQACNAIYIYDYSRKITSNCPFCKITKKKELSGSSSTKSGHRMRRKNGYQTRKMRAQSKNTAVCCHYHRSNGNERDYEGNRDQ